ncbi:flagellar filament outer layer protein FlaA [Treponema pedis]|nr:flagellar filament outer layer protein FlaA [Treponema pedis]QOW60270.1 hypothetical protein IFE08_10620 [Treponema pedis]QSI05614.1 hypothetical protein DYQ05_12215 [Treponema pedis]
MKHGGLIFAGIVLVLLFAFMPLTARDGSVNYQTYMVDAFDEPDGQEWSYHAVGSKFVTEGYPKIKYFDGMPRAVRVMQEEPEKAKFLGLEVKFNRKGDNWVDIVPTKDGNPYEIPFKGHIHRLDMWVWGAGYYYDLEILVRDCEGRVHTLPMGLVNFKGWNNMHVTVPTNIPQSSKYLGNKKHLSFVAFRIRTRPSERVDEFKIFFDQFKALTDAFMDSFDGYELYESDFNGDKDGGENNGGSDAEGK